MLTGSVVYFWQRPKDEKVVGGMPQYTDPNGRYTFRYPSNWKVLDRVPQKFRSVPLYGEDGDLEGWLNGKMMAGTCRGPVLQNTDDEN